EGADRHVPRGEVAAAHGEQPRAQEHGLAVGHVDAVAVVVRAGRGLPRVAHDRAQPSPRVVRHEQLARRRLGEPHGRGDASAYDDVAGAGRQARVDEARETAEHEPAEPRRMPRYERDDGDAERHEERGATREDHQRGTGTAASTVSSTVSALTPSSSASGRSWTRWRSVGCARALTSSGVTKLRPDSHAQAREVASSAVAPRGETPSESEGDMRVARHTSTM